MHPDADKVNIASGLKIKWSGTFDVGDFYNKLKLWLFHEGFGDENKNFKEVKYVQRIKPYGREIDLKWVGEKNVSDYFSYSITITMLIFALKDVEVPYNGRKVKMNSASIDIRLFADFIKNRKGKWKKNSLMKKIYEKFIVKDRLDAYKINLYHQIYGFHDYIKEYLNLQKF